MDKKEFAIFFTLIGISTLFAIAGFAMYLTRGKSKFWTAKKMRLGALLLTITAATTIHSCKEGEERTTCYEQAQLTDGITLHTDQPYIDLNTTDTVSGTITYRSSKTYSFMLKNDSLQSIFQKGILLPNDGAFNDSVEDFLIKVDKNLVPGRYTLSIFNTGINEQESSLMSYGLELKK